MPDQSEFFCFARNMVRLASPHTKSRQEGPLARYLITRVASNPSNQEIIKIERYRTRASCSYALALDHLNLAAYQQGEELKKMQEGHTKKPIVPADEFYAIEKPKLAEDELATALVKECLLTDPTLSKKISKYRAPVFDYGNFDIPSNN